MEKENIRIKKFEHGIHYYAYVGKHQVVCGSTRKWNSFDEAYKQALQYIKFNNSII